MRPDAWYSAWYRLPAGLAPADPANFEPRLFVSIFELSDQLHYEQYPRVHQIPVPPVMEVPSISTRYAIGQNVWWVTNDSTGFGRYTRIWIDDLEVR